MYGIEKEMIEDYGIESSVWIGGKRIVLGINEENTEKPRYMSCIVTDNGLFGRYEGITTDDYFEALKHFGENIGDESIILRNDQKIDGLKDTACLTPKDMIPIDWHYSIKECIQYRQITLYIELLQNNGTRQPDNITKHIEENIWELRPGNNRVFYFYYENNTFVLLHHFRKKAQKTPQREIEQAKAERNDYLRRKEAVKK